MEILAANSHLLSMALNLGWKVLLASLVVVAIWSFVTRGRGL